MTRRPRILVISPYMCRGDTAAGDQRLQRIIEQLAKFAEVDFLTPEAEPVKLPGERRYWSGLRKLGVRIVNPLFMHRLPLLCRSRIRPYDWILIEFWYLADRLASSLEELRRELSYTLIAIDSVDLIFLRERAALECGSNVYGSEAEIEMRQQQEISTYLGADLVIVCSQEDAQALASVTTNPIVVIPIVVLSRPRNLGVRGNVILFVGGFKHLPNVDAVLWFVHEVFPLIRAKVPDALFRIVGSHPPAEVQELRDSPGVEVLGYVADTSKCLDCAAVSVAPLRYGAGMKGKVAEALSAAVPVVTTTFGARIHSGVGKAHRELQLC
jgi:glycosyltransferase involved in cell wall biosynthesis